MGRLSDLVIEFGQEGAQQVLDRLWLSRSHGQHNFAQFRTTQRRALEKLSDGSGQDISTAGVSGLPFEGVKCLGKASVKTDVRPGVLRHPCLTGGASLMGPPVPGLLHGCSKLHMRTIFVAPAAQAEGSNMTPDDSLLVAPPSSVRLEPYPGDVTTARKGRPDAAAHSAPRAGSNSKDGPAYGDCRACNSSWPLDGQGLVPAHADPDSPRGWTRPTCDGSRRPPSVVSGG